MNNTHPNSKTVTIFRARSFAADAQKGLEDFYATSTKSIGSYWESTSSKKVGTGLSISEQDLLMPYMIDIPADDREFRKKVKEFFDEINTKIPYKDGLKLEIGLETDNTKKISKENLPIEIMDYIRWRHAMGHPEVAENKAEGEGNQLKKYYIFDPNTLKESTNNLRQARDKALEYYLIVKNDKDKVDNFLAMLGHDPRAYADFDDKLAELDLLINASDISKVQDFVNIYEDPKLENRSMLRKMVQTGVLKQVGTRYLIAETDKILGNSEEEALLELEDEVTNGQLILILKSQLQEKQKAKVQAKKKK